MNAPRVLTPDNLPRVVVTAAVIERDGTYLVARRPAGVHLEGMWEFPGGKCHAGESFEACLIREIREELGCEVEVGREVFSTSHAYPERVVELHFFACALNGEPAPVMGQEIRWVARSALAALEFPPADEALIALLSKRTAGT
jgi:8-oxo-dGTP diphosphatase